MSTGAGEQRATERASLDADESAARLHSTTDAHVWADEFARHFGNDESVPDWETMVGWFANAIEVGRMAGQRAVERADEGDERWCVPATAKGTAIAVDEWNHPLHVHTTERPHPLAGTTPSPRADEGDERLRGFPYGIDVVSRAIATIDDSHETHVHWAEWRRKGHDTDEDHEMVGDLAYHEAAIADYAVVLNVLAALRAALAASSETGSGLDVERLARALHEGTLHNSLGGVDDELAKRACVQFGWEQSRCRSRAAAIAREYEQSR